MGIIFAAIVLLPMMGMGGARLIKAEATGPLSSASDFSARTSAIKLYIVYVAITVAMQLSLMAEGLNAYDAAIHMFGALGTGGFSSYNTSIGTFDSPWVDYTVSIFMLLCSINFILVVQLFTGKWRTTLRNTELRWFGMEDFSEAMLLSAAALGNNGWILLLLTDVRPDALLGIGGKLFLIPVMLAGRALLILRLKGRK